MGLSGALFSFGRPGIEWTFRSQRCSGVISLKLVWIVLGRKCDAEIVAGNQRSLPVNLRECQLHEAFVNSSRGF